MSDKLVIKTPKEKIEALAKELEAKIEDLPAKWKKHLGK